MNFSDGFVSDSTLRFHTAWAASNAPPLSPMRGSGVGGMSDRFAFGLADVVDGRVEGAHPVAAKTLTASAAGKKARASGRRIR